MTSKRSVIGLGFGLLVAGAVQLAATGEARACSCVNPEVTGVSPTSGSIEVPLNTRLWMSARAVDQSGAPALRDSTGKTIALQQSRLIGPGFETAVFTPEEELAPNTEYTATLRDDESWVFTTGATRDGQPPALPAVINRQPFSSGEDLCGRQAGITFSIDHEGFLLVVDRDGTEELDAGNLTGTVSNMINAKSITMGTGCNVGWPDAREGAAAELRFGAFDRAGNFSGWTQSEDTGIEIPTVSIEDPTSCTCAGTTGPRGGSSVLFFSLIGMAFAFARARRLAAKTLIAGAGALFAIAVLQLAACGGGVPGGEHATIPEGAAEAPNTDADRVPGPTQPPQLCGSVKSQSMWCATLFNGELNSGAMIGLDDGELCLTASVPASDGISSLFFFGDDVAACDLRSGWLFTTNMAGGSISGSPFPCEAVTRWNEGLLMRFVPGTPAFVLGPNQPSPDGRLAFFSSFDAVFAKSVSLTIPNTSDATRMAVLGDTLYMASDAPTEVERYQLPLGEDLGVLSISGFSGKLRGLGAASSSLILTDGRELFIHNRETGALVRSLAPLPEHSAIFGLACQERM